MNRIPITLLIVAVALAGGILIGQRLGGPPASSDSASGASDEPEILYWVAPMDPNFRRDKPGKSPMGMDLVPVYANEAGGSDGVPKRLIVFHHSQGTVLSQFVPTGSETSLIISSKRVADASLPVTSR